MSGIVGVSAGMNSGLVAASAGGGPGSIVQTVVVKKDDEASASFASTTFGKVLNGSGVAAWRGSITPTAGNDVMVQASFSARMQITSNNGGGFGFMRDTGSPSNSGGTAIYHAPERHMFYTTSSFNPFYAHWAIRFVDQAMSAGTYNYYIGCSLTTASGQNFIIRIPFEMQLLEIKR